MKLTPMRYKDYTWPHNPETCQMVMERKIAVHKAPFGGYCLQDLGGICRVIRGEGVFAGEGAYESFRALAEVFRQEGAGVLVHPVWQAVRARFAALEVLEEPRPDYVRYTFEFWEEGEMTGMTVLSAGTEESAPEAENNPGVQNGTTAGAEAETETGLQPETQPDGESVPAAGESSGAVYHTVSKGETLWGIGKRYGVALNALLKLNPQIRNPNLIHPGNEVRIR